MDDIDHAYCELDSLRTGLYRIRDRFGSIFKVFYKAPVSGSAYPNDAYIYLYDIASPSPDTWMAIPSKADMISYLGISGISDSHIIYIDDDNIGFCFCLHTGHR